MYIGQLLIGALFSMIFAGGVWYVLLWMIEVITGYLGDY